MTFILIILVVVVGGGGTITVFSILTACPGGGEWFTSW